MYITTTGASEPNERLYQNDPLQAFIFEIVMARA